jgi:cyclopropane-fatty-acyl-phospholipid synthase
MVDPIASLIARRYAGRDLPVAVVLPSGERVALSREPRLDLVARNMAGLRVLASPQLGNLARAYVHNDLDFTGSARDILNIAQSLVGDVTHAGDALATRWRLWRNQRRPNRANIAHHYDVSNAFYRLWLDSRMVYSCAYYRHDEDTLDEAQAAKLDHVCRKLRLAPGERFLDIGCGWGALLFHAATHYGVVAHGITLSRNQLDHARQEIARRGLEGRVRVDLLDYADLPTDASYDKIASIGMFEHVGLARFDRYFGAIRRALVPGGLVLNHGITHNFVGRHSLGSGLGDFVEDYVFPGGELTHVSKVIEALGAQGLEVLDAEALRPHYARTLWCWADRLEAQADAARAEVGEEKFRVWRIYLAGAAHAFDRGWLSLFQVLAGKPHADGRLVHPMTRDYMYPDAAG